MRKILLYITITLLALATVGCNHMPSEPSCTWQPRQTVTTYDGGVYYIDIGICT